MHSLWICGAFSNFLSISTGCVRCNWRRQGLLLSKQLQHFSKFSTVISSATHRQHSIYPKFSDMSHRPRPALGDEGDISDIRKIFNSAVESVLPRTMIEDALELRGNELRVKDVAYKLNRNIYVVGFGKAVLGMARAAEDLLHTHIVTGILSVPYGSQKFLTDIGKSDLLLSPDSKITVYEGAEYNLPDEAAHSTAKKILDLSESLTKNDILLVLVSGGGSALLPLPKPPVTLDDMHELTKLMSTNGATIKQLNIVRRNIEVLKGGGLAQAAHAAKVIALIMSDVTGDKLEIISSGPTVNNLATPKMCHYMFKTLGIEEKVPDTVKKVLTEAEAMEKHFSSEDKPAFDHVQNIIVGSNSIATQAAYDAALALRYVPFVLSTELEGEAKEVGLMFAKLAKYIMSSFYGCNPDSDSYDLVALEFELLKAGVTKLKLNEIIRTVRNATNSDMGICIISGGETVVRVKGSGVGGRNQEMTVSCGVEFSKVIQDSLRDKFSVEFLSCGTDGQDGPTAAAGGAVDLMFTEECEKSRVDLVAYLENNDTNNLLSKVKDGEYLVNTGFTGTNVMDIQLLIVKQR